MIGRSGGCNSGHFGHPTMYFSHLRKITHFVNKTDMKKETGKILTRQQLLLDVKEMN